MRIKGQPSKYRAVRTTVDGVTFASKAEARRYSELRLLEKAGKVWGIELQPRYVLTVIGGERKDYAHKIGTYVGDFSYYRVDEHGGSWLTIEDVKGFDTPLSKWKRKHVEAQYGITVQIVK